jgi:thiamine biosynthesis lipoprotein
MGTTWSVKLAAAPATAVQSVAVAIQGELDRVVAQMSTWESGSDLSRFNAAPPGTEVTLQKEFYAVLARALALSQETGGAYDPTVGPLVNLWGFGPEGRRHEPPAAEEVAGTMARCGWQRLHLDHPRRRLCQPGGVHLDLSSIAKGFAVDQVAECLKRLGFDSFLVEIGGELRGEGMKPDGAPWWIMLERPRGDATEGGGMVDIVVAGHGLSVATSGDSQRFFESGGTRFAHTIDPRTGYPTANGLVSVSVLHPSCMEADALATAFTVLGAPDAMRYASEHGIAVSMASMRDGVVEELMSPAFAAMLQ